MTPLSANVAPAPKIFTPPATTPKVVVGAAPQPAQKTTLPVTSIVTPPAMTGAELYAKPGSYDAAMGNVATPPPTITPAPIVAPPVATPATIAWSDASGTYRTGTAADKAAMDQADAFKKLTPEQKQASLAAGNLTNGSGFVPGALTPGVGSGIGTAPTASDYSTDQGYKDAQAAAVAARAEGFKAEEFAKQLAEQTAALEIKYKRLEDDARIASENESGQRFSNLAGVGVNPLSSGAANVSGDITRNLGNALSNLAQQKNAELSTIRATLLNQRNDQAEKAYKGAQDTMTMIRQSAMDRNAAAQEAFDNGIKRVQALAAEAKSTYDFSQQQKDDAAKTITDQIANAPDTLKNMDPKTKADLERRAGWATGQIDTMLAKNVADAAKKVAADAAKVISDEKEAALKEGFVYIKAPSDLAKLPAGSQIQYGADGRMYAKPPVNKPLMNVSPGSSVYDPTTGTFKTAPKAKGTGGGGTGGGTYSQTAIYDKDNKQIGVSLYNSKTLERKATDLQGNPITIPEGARLGSTSFNPSDQNATRDLVLSALSE